MKKCMHPIHLAQDELNCRIGIIPHRYIDITRIQSQLIFIGGVMEWFLDNSIVTQCAQTKILGFTTELHQHIVNWNETLPPQTAFVIPKNTYHLARTATRFWHYELTKVDTPSEVLEYADTLSELFYLLARYYDKCYGGEVFYDPQRLIAKD